MFRTLVALTLLAAPAHASDAASDAAAENAAPAPASAAQPATVEAARVTPVELRVPVSGSLVARSPALIYPQLAGTEVTELLVEPGDRVTRGQVLARLSQSAVKAQLAQAEAEAQRSEAAVRQASNQIDSAEATFAQALAALKRTRQLQQGGSATRAALDDVIAAEAAARAQAASARDGLAVAEAARAQAEAAVDLARLNLDWTEVTSPVDGVVSARDAQLGVMGSASGDPMFTIISDGSIEWQAEVVETALKGLKLGDPAIATVAGLGEVEGRVRRLPAAVDPATRLGELRITLDASDGLRPGLFASGWVIIDRHEGLTVPLTAVLDDAGGQVVQVVADGTVETRTVAAGVIWQGRREILSGLKAGEQVITRAGAFFRDGDHVVTVTAPDAGAEAGADRDQPPPGGAARAEVAP
ncbi:efflux RND transporter periplasmic adaptor subunit [Paracoccus xiamenensis]|uniref:efflux RND transporter periplasmic adaptor subunit n=1 Tax=Paracoccus xiamenensis TaxID=2714901 RepID=UPI002E28153E|nr:efflux RND transporter periplasmic adaptor subunit [Paracoccus xiamenensis]